MNFVGIIVVKQERKGTLMLSVFVCENQDMFLNRIAEGICDYIRVEKLDASIVCATSSPNKILEYLQEKSVFGLYFLALELDADFNGFQLATEIRKYDPRAFIVIVTNDSESRHLSFKYAIEALDYITKDRADFNSRLCNCVRVAYDRHLENMANRTKTLEVKLSEDIQLKNKIRISKGEFAYLDYNEIFYITVTAGKSHQISIHAVSGLYVSRGELSKIQELLDSRFARCFKSYIVNTQKIQSVSIREGKIRLINGQELYISRTYIEQVRDKLKTGINFA